MKKLCLIFLLFLGLNSFATHIVGGELIYDFLYKDAFTNHDFYRVTLKVYRDCAAGNADFDGTNTFNSSPAIITVRTSGGVLTGTYNIGSPFITKVPPTINSRCIGVPGGICVEEAIYSMVLSLPPSQDGYNIIYQRCCRNNTINNLLTPGEIGSTYYTKIPGPNNIANPNNSPRFKKFPPIFVCNNVNFIFDHSATDPDNDSLAYSFYTPFLGLDACCPAIGPQNVGNCSAPPPFCDLSAAAGPYGLVPYISPYSESYPLDANPAFAIDAVTGILSGRPTLIGQFVVGICVKEYRNGLLINTHFRDFQFNVRNCNAEVVANIKDQFTTCMGNTINFVNLSTATGSVPTARWDFGVNNLLNDTSNLFSPSYQFPDTGRYVVTLIANPGKDCSDTIKKVFYAYPPFDVKFPPKATQCFSNNSFNFNPGGLYPVGTSFKWDFTSSANPSVSILPEPKNVVYDKAGVFIVTLSANYAICRDTAIGKVQVFDPENFPSETWDTTVVIGQLIPLNGFVGGGYTYTWTPLIDYLNCGPCNDPNPESSTTSEITYTLIFEDAYQCATKKSTYHILIENKAAIDVPTAFTPNGDGVNDIIYVDGYGIKKLDYFKIFNRWGQLLFESDDIKIGWNGIYNNVAQNMETYVYEVSAETYLEKNPKFLKTGTFRLIR